MNFNPYQNYGAGIAALGPVQSMSDRNEAQTYMANGGQMYASGGIARLAGGGLDSTKNALDKYKYDPVTQRYTLQGEDEATTAMDEELLRRKRAAEAAGGSGYTPQQPSEWSQRSPAERAAYYADRPIEAALARGVQTIFGNTLPGAASKFFAPDAWHSSYAEKQGFDPSQTSFGRGKGSLFGFFGSGLEATPKAGADVYGYGYSKDNPLNTNYNGSLNRDPDAPSLFNPSWSSGYEGVGGPGTYSSPSADPSTSPPSSEPTNSFESAYGWAHGGLAALARGGMSHLGDYSDGGRLLRGPGDGVSDSIPATIGNKRPARLADGEFVVPARIVSELGNGSTEAGARKLYAMMDRIQKARKKSIGKDRVAVNSRAEKNLPA
jgi:hypothetical protein